MESAYVFYGSLYNARDKIVEEPSILLDPEVDAFLGWGERLDLMVVELSSLPKEMACYIIRRMAEYTASGFVQQFCEHQDDPDALEWLSREMQRVPISTEKAWKT